jgi:hypothetical protein
MRNRVTGEKLSRHGRHNCATACGTIAALRRTRRLAENRADGATPIPLRRRDMASDDFRQQQATRVTRDMRNAVGRILPRIFERFQTCSAVVPLVYIHAMCCCPFGS